MTTKTIKTPKTGLNGVVPASVGEVLTLIEAAGFLRVSADGLKVDAVAGRVPGQLVAGEWRFSRVALLTWLNQFATKPAEPEPQPKSSKEQMLALAGMWKDDPTVDAMVEEIYRQRKLDPVGGNLRFMFVLDTNTLTDLFKGQERIRARIAAIPAERSVVTTMISWFEIISGRFASVRTAADREELLVAAERLANDERQLARLTILPITIEVADQFERLRANGGVPGTLHTRISRRFATSATRFSRQFRSRATISGHHRANKKLKKIGRQDLLIACIALANRATLVTRNTKDFTVIPALKIENWAD